MRSIKYPSVVEAIHKEFSTASDLLLANANEILAGIDEDVIAKGRRLTSLGFINARQVEESTKADAARKANLATANTIIEYSMSYPSIKFITEARVEEICKKYNLVMGTLDRYKGFVPEANLTQIEQFPFIKVEHRLEPYFVVTEIKYNDSSYYSAEVAKIKRYLKSINNCFTVSAWDRTHYSYKDILCEAAGVYRYSSSAIVEVTCEATNPNDCVICAPEKDMDTTGAKKDGFKLTKLFSFKEEMVHVPDPIVLQPVKDGYLIVTMWGDENFDPKNEPDLLAGSN